MAMSSCEKCWDSPCSCGWDYRNWSKLRRIQYAAVILGFTEKELVDSLKQGDCIVQTDHPLKGSQ